MYVIKMTDMYIYNTPVVIVIEHQRQTYKQRQIISSHNSTERSVYSRVKITKILPNVFSQWESSDTQTLVGSTTC